MEAGGPHKPTAGSVQCDPSIGYLTKAQDHTAQAKQTPRIDWPAYALACRKASVLWPCCTSGGWFHGRILTLLTTLLATLLLETRLVVRLVARLAAGLGREIPLATDLYEGVRADPGG